MSELLLGNSLKFGVADTPTREGEVVQKFEDIYNIPTPVVGMSVFVRETEKSYIVKSLKKENVGGKEVYTKVDEVVCMEEELESIKTENVGRDAEISANKVKVNALTNSLNSEVTRAQEAEAALNDLINGEGSNAKYSTRFIGAFNNLSNLLAGLDSLVYDESKEDKNLGSFRALLNQRIVEIKNVSLVRSGSSLVQVVSGPFEESNGSLSLSSTEYGIFSRIHDNTWSQWKRLTTTMGEVNAAISKAIAGLINEAPENLDTLREIANWIEEHGGEVEAIYSAIEDNTEKIDAEQRRAEQAEAELEKKIAGASGTMLYEVGYGELVSLRNNADLVEGALYRITDYVTTTTKANTSSAGHSFDIIVEALAKDILSEDAKAVWHDGDDYFAECDLTAWELKYCLDNNTSRFAWADTEYGKGVIYYMKDERGNECPYDFKNIMFGDYFTFSYTVDGVIYDGTVRSEVKYCYGNVIKQRWIGGVQNINGIVFKNIFFGSGCYNNTFDSGCSNNTFDSNCYNNTFDSGCSNNTFDSNCYNNTLGSGCYNNTFRSNCYNNTFDSGCYNNTFDSNCYNNTLGSGCYNNTFDSNCYNNTLGSGCSNNTLGSDCYNNTFDSNCYNNTLGSSCSYNTLGSGCSNNTLGSSCSYNTLGSGCSNNTFRSGCNDRQLNTRKTSITLNEEYYDDGTNELVPIKHPDLSTQPSILPYKFMGQYVYEQLIPTSEIVLTNDNYAYLPASLIGGDFILDCCGIGTYGAMPILLTSNILLNTQEMAWFLNSQLGGKGFKIFDYIKIVYTSMPEEGGYYYNDVYKYEKGILVLIKGNLSDTPTLTSLYNGDVMIEPVVQGQEYYYDIPNDYRVMDNVGFSIITTSYITAISYSTPGTGGPKGLEFSASSNGYYLNLHELINEAKQHLITITIE